MPRINYGKYQNKNSNNKKMKKKSIVSKENYSILKRKIKNISVLGRVCSNNSDKIFLKKNKNKKENYDIELLDSFNKKIRKL